MGGVNTLATMAEISGYNGSIVDHVPAIYLSPWEYLLVYFLDSEFS